MSDLGMLISFLVLGSLSGFLISIVEFNRKKILTYSVIGCGGGFLGFIGYLVFLTGNDKNLVVHIFLPIFGAVSIIHFFVKNN